MTIKPLLGGSNILPSNMKGSDKPSLFGGLNPIFKSGVKNISPLKYVSIGLAVIGLYFLVRRG